MVLKTPTVLIGVHILYIYMFIHAPYNKFPGVMCLNPELDIESIYLH